MAVEASHLNNPFFSPQFLANREMMNPIETNVVGNVFETQIGYGVPLSNQGLLPLYNSLVNDSSILHQKAIKSESNLTYNINLPLKRSRDSVDPIVSFQPPVQRRPRTINEACSGFSFLGNDISLHMEKQQFDIDSLISQHMETIRMEIDEKRKRQARKIMEAIEERVSKKLRGKEEEIDKIEKLNWALEERVKSLCIENQIWRDLAQTNEATAIALRSNLEQVLAVTQQTKVDGRNRGVGLEAAVAEEVDDAQSCCGSSWDVERHTLLEAGGRSGEKNAGADCDGDGGGGRLCRNCREKESCVLLLPCRHLCLCSVCGSGLHICPVCKSPKNASLHIKFS